MDLSDEESKPLASVTVTLHRSGGCCESGALGRNSCRSTNISPVWPSSASSSSGRRREYADSCCSCPSASSTLSGDCIAAAVRAKSQLTCDQGHRKEVTGSPPALVQRKLARGRRHFCEALYRHCKSHSSSTLTPQQLVQAIAAKMPLLTLVGHRMCRWSPTKLAPFGDYQRSRLRLTGAASNALACAATGAFRSATKPSQLLR